MHWILDSRITEGVHLVNFVNGAVLLLFAMYHNLLTEIQFAELNDECVSVEEPPVPVAESGSNSIIERGQVEQGRVDAEEKE